MQAGGPSLKAWERACVWLGVVSLDAPLVALGWEWLIDHTFRLQLTWVHYLMLGNSVWLVYAGDRLTDGLRLGSTRAVSPRRRFALEHRMLLLVLLVLSVLLNGLLAICFLDAESIRLGVGLLLLVGLYLLLAHLPATRRFPLPLKEVLVAMLFMAGVLLFPFARSRGNPASLAPTALVLFLLFLGNTVAIAYWEIERDRAEGQDSLATVFPELAPVLPWALALLAAGALGVGMYTPAGGTSTVMVTAAAAATVLLALNGLHDRADPDALRTLADLALLAPIPAIFLLR